MRLLTFLLLLPALSFAQVPHTFQNGDVADADKINQNFNYVLENASGGCSATQQDNSVLIECADGTAGVIAGAGTVVVYPEGQIGDVPPIDYENGPVVVKDFDGVILGEFVSSTRGSPTIATTAYSTAAIDNNFAATSVELGSVYVQIVYFSQPDCEGAVFTRFPDDTVKVDRGYFVRDALATQPETILVESEQQSAGWTDGNFIEIAECINRQSAQSVYRNLPYTPAPEILNAAYPVRLEQLP